MRHILLFAILVLFNTVSQAADVVGQRYIDQMTQGGNHSLKQAAQSIYNTGEKSTEVLDVAAEVLIQRYSTAIKSDLDTLAWVARAIGNSRNPRYHTILKEIVDSDAHKKIRKYAKAALKQVGDPDGNQYVKGTVDLKAMRSGKKSTSSKNTPAKKKSSAKQSLDIVREGMSMAEVFDLVGQPDATTQHQTGKAWIPFNFGAKDVVRSVALYKGQGRVIFSHDGHNYSGGKVLEVIINPEETGYP